MMRVRLARRNDTFLFYCLIFSHILHLSPNFDLNCHDTFVYSIMFFCVSDLFACMASFWSFCSEGTGPSPVDQALEVNDTTIDL